MEKKLTRLRWLVGSSCGRFFDEACGLENLSPVEHRVRSTLSNYERGTKRIGLTSLVLIADVLDVNVDYLLFGVVGEKKDLLEEQEILDNLKGCSEKQRKALLQVQRAILNGFN